ncbi:MAG: aldo/keto reductase [Nitrososphaeria archaeon]|nr:aldo/keto reductase [Nitrososphaeria archaeon]
MEFRRIGKTDFFLPVLGFGTWEIGGRDYPDYSNDGQAIEVIRYAIRRGIKFIDTAEMYGAGHAEEIVGEAISTFPREEVFIATKVWPYNLRYKDIFDAIGHSLERLKVDYVDLYQIHFPNPFIPIREAMRALENLVDEGKIRFIGVSNFNVRELEEAMSCLSKYDIVSNQVLYNPMDRLIEEEILPFCKKNDITVIAYRPLGKGLLLQDPYRKVLLEIGAKYGKTPAQVLINWVIRHEGVITLARTMKKEHLDELLGGIGWKMNPEDYEKLPELLSRSAGT